MSKDSYSFPQHIPAVASRFHGFGMTHVGKVRDRNEDAILTDPNGTLWAIADGMGGLGQGDVASEIVIDKIAALSDSDNAVATLAAAIADANDEILARRGDGQMGATFVAAMIRRGEATILWMGDCRAYLYRGRKMRQLTHDHTLVQDMIDQGLLREKNREEHPERHVVTRAIGVEHEIEIDDVSVRLYSGDLLLLCSDGLTACAKNADLLLAAKAAETPEVLCKSLISLSLERGAPDNVSVVAVRGMA